MDAAVWYTQLDQFEPEQLLEGRLYSALNQPAALPPDPYVFIKDLASENPTPGGGSAAAFTAAEAAALVAMVGRVTVGKKKYADVETQMWQMVENAEKLRLDLTRAVEEDAASFQGYMTALRLPKSTEDEIAARNAAIESATLNAARVPFHTAEKTLQVLDLAVTAATLGNLNAISDAASAANLALAAMRSAILNVKINMKSLQDPSTAGSLIEDSERLLALGDERMSKVVEQLRLRADL